MAEHLELTRECPSPPPGAMDMVGRPLSLAVRAAGERACKDMGLNTTDAFSAASAMAEQLQRDHVHEAISAAMRYLDLTGAYRLMAVLLCAAAAEA